MNWKEVYKKRRAKLIILLAMVAIFTYLFARWQSENPYGFDKHQWQAIFLSNNQVYFGKLEIRPDFYVLTRVFYLQTEEDKKELTAGEAPSESKEKREEGETRLIKLGRELHGPEDRLFVEKSNLLFWENLKADSSIVKSIESYYRGE